MEAMFAACNPGLSRRFQIENAFEFEDYDDSSLVRILVNRCSRDGLKISTTTAAEAVKQLARAKAKPNFGNAGAVNNLLATAKLKLQRRQSTGTMNVARRTDELIIEDFGEITKPVTECDLFDGLVGCDSVRAKLKEYHSLITLCQRNGEDPKKFVEFNFIFAGSPG